MDFKTVVLQEEPLAVVILDQALLPHETKYTALTSIEAVWQAIKDLQVRGAPAIGIAAAMGFFVHMSGKSHLPHEAFFDEADRARGYLCSARPTAVNLEWAVKRMTDTALRHKALPVSAIVQALGDEARTIYDEDLAVCRAIGMHGSTLIEPGMGILTHCNAGALATAAYGTALAPLYYAHRAGIKLKVFADETRPLLQGARLTAYELQRAGVDVTLICDNMVSSVMQQGWVDAVFVGCDRVAANGDTANKIGTSGVAILAAAYSIPFYVCAPYSTIDFSTPDGDGIVIEQRDTREVTDLWYKTPMSPGGIDVYNPSFDVTKARYITAFVTENGIMQKPTVIGSGQSALN